MDLEEFLRSEYEIQHFNFSVAQLKLEHRLMVKKVVAELTTDMANSIIKKSKVSEEVGTEIRKQTEKVTENMLLSFSEVFGEFDNLMEKYFRIPDTIILAEDYKQEIAYTEADEEFYKKKVADMEKTFKQNLYMLTALDKEINMYKQLQPVIERENEIAGKIDEALKLQLNLDQSTAILKQATELVNSEKNQQN